MFLTSYYEQMVQRRAGHCICPDILERATGKTSRSIGHGTGSNTEVSTGSAVQRGKLA